MLNTDTSLPVAWDVFHPTGEPEHPICTVRTQADADQFARNGFLLKPLRYPAEYPQSVRELLAVLNGDGGQRQHAVGVEQAALEALSEVHRLRQALAEHAGVPSGVLEGALALIEQHVPYPTAAAQDLRRLLGKEAP